MKHGILFGLLILGLLLAACSPVVPDETTSPGEMPVVTEPVSYPAPEQPVVTNPGAYPEPGGSTVPTQPSVPAGNWSRGEVFIDSSELVLRESNPMQVALLVRGNLPTPCHQLAYVVNPPDANNQVMVELYSQYDASVMCIQVLQPFEQIIELGNFENEDFKVILNGEDIGEIQ